MSHSFPLGVYFVWDCASWAWVFPFLCWEGFQLLCLQIFSQVCSFPFGTPTVPLLVCLMLSQRSLTLSSFLSFFFLHSVTLQWFPTLSFSSIICSSASVILLLTLSSVFFFKLKKFFNFNFFNFWYSILLQRYILWSFLLLIFKDFSFIVIFIQFLKVTFHLQLVLGLVQASWWAGLVSTHCTWSWVLSLWWAGLCPVVCLEVMWAQYRFRRPVCRRVGLCSCAAVCLACGDPALVPVGYWVRPGLDAKTAASGRANADQYSPGPLPQRPVGQSAAADPCLPRRPSRTQVGPALVPLELLAGSQCTLCGLPEWSLCFSRPVELLHSSPTGLQSQVLWGLFVPMPDPQAGEPTRCSGPSGGRTSVM